MKLIDGLKNDKPTLSFEVFPPKNETTLEDVMATTQQIAALRPAFVSVTYGAGGGTSRYTLAIAENMYKTTGVPTLAHLTCISSTRQTVAERIADMREHGIENVMALRGDLTPEQKGSDRSNWCASSRPPGISASAAPAIRRSIPRAPTAGRILPI